MIIDKAKLKALVEQGSLPPIISALIEEIERLEGSVQSLIQMERNTGNRALEYAGKCDQLRADLAGLRTGYEAYERVNAELKAECARSTEREIQQLAEIEALRQIISDSATSCGAAVSVECTLDFMKHLPVEIFSVISKLRNALAECANSLQGEMLQKFGGQLPDDMHPVTRREYDRDMAELSGYRAALGQGEQS